VKTDLNLLLDLAELKNIKICIYPETSLDNHLIKLLYYIGNFKVIQIFLYIKEGGPDCGKLVS
jgi:hypothetical protein